MLDSTAASGDLGLGARARHAWAGLLLTLVAVVLVGTHVASYDAFSPIDEFQHYDYVVRVLSGELVQTGERVGPEAMAEESCRGVDAPGVVLPPCGATDQQRPEAYQELGFNTASGHSPLYYALTAGPARLLTAASPLSLFSASRLVGALWLAGGLLLVLAVGRELRVPVPALVGTCLWAAGSPALLHSLSTVNPDSTALVAGGLVLLAGLRWDGGRWPLWALCASAALATALKVTNVLGVLAVAVFLLLRAPGTTALARLRGRVAPLLALGASALAPQVVWTLYTGATAVVDPATIPMTQRFAVPSIGLRDLLGNVSAVVNPTTGYTPGFLAVSAFVSLSAAALGWLLLGGMVGAALGGVEDGARLDLARANLLLALVGGPLIVVLTYLGAGAYFPVPARYGLSLLPGSLVLVACLARGRAAGLVLLGLGALSPLAVLSAAF